MKSLLLLVLAFTAAAAKQRIQFTRYRSWNTRMYPVWKDGDSKFRNSWLGGKITFDLNNDGPILTGAKVSFNINLNFPPNQTMLADGQVVWAHNCTVNKKEYQEGEAVYPDLDSEWTGVFPDGTPFTESDNKKPRYVFVWKTWGRYWQVADGPSSSLTIGTDNVPLGSYNMDVVIYHCRGQDKFIPLGYASTVFTITDQIPFTISLNQVNDINQNDQNFIQNEAIAFTVKLHDPSMYLNAADISFSWDFGDSSGTLISRESTVTHTYLAVGTFKPQVVVMASIPTTCEVPTEAAPLDASAAPAVVAMASTPAAAAAGDAIALDVPASDAAPVVNTGDGETVVNTDTEVMEVASVGPAEVDTVVVPAAGEVTAVETDTAAADVAAEEMDAAEENVAVIDVAPVAEGEEVETVTVTPVAEAVEAAAAADAEDVQAETAAPADNVVTAAVTEPAAVEEAAPAEMLETENEVASTTEVAEVDTDPAQVALAVAKRQAPELTADCTVYRYGSLATSIDVVQPIESVEIVQVSNVEMATELDQSAVDVTISCQGSLPSEVCTIISDAECITPVQTICDTASPSPDCQLVLRQFFNDSGVFCVNVSLTNDVSLAVASARVSVIAASAGSPAGTAATILGVMVLACVICCIGLMYRRFKQYQPLREDSAGINGGSSAVTSVPLLLWNLLSRQSPGESRPLLQGRIV